MPFATSKNTAHSELMEAKSRNVRDALRVAIRSLLRASDKESIREINKIEPGFLTPDFYNLKTDKPL